jgi:flagellin
MALYIQTNAASISAQKNLSLNQSKLHTTFARLSSGYRINTAADDAAGLAISDKMVMQIRSMSVAERNANDGISMAQTGEAALGEITNILTRMRELATQAANATLGSTDRTYVKTEFQQLQNEIVRIQQATVFNGQALIASTANASATSFQIGTGTGAENQISFNRNGVKLSASNTTNVGVASAGAAKTAMSVIDSTLQVVSTRRSQYGAAMNRLEVAVSSLQTMRLNLSAANSRIRDVDVAEETSQLSRTQVLVQAGTAVLAQANMTPQSALGLLR